MKRCIKNLKKPRTETKRKIRIVMLKLVCFFVLGFLISCQKETDVSFLDGKFISDDGDSLAITLKDDIFIYEDLYPISGLSTYSCCSIIAIGNWKYNEKHSFLVINSPDSANNPFLHRNIAENENGAEDSLYIHISNPLETLYANGAIQTREAREILYRVFIGTTDVLFFTDVAYLYHDSNKLVFSKPINAKINSIQIEIIPDYDFRGRNLPIRSFSTLKYTVENPYSNVFDIYIPELDYEYLTYLRFTDDYIRVVNNDTLLWDGIRYVRSE